MKKLFLLPILLFLAGCSSFSGRLGVIAPEGTKFSYQDIQNATMQKNVTAEDTTGILLFIPFGFPNFDTVIQKALKEGNGDIIVDATLTEETTWYVLFGYKTMRLNGNVVRLGNKGGSRYE